MRKTIAVLAAVTALLTAAPATHASAPASAVKEPVILVHGWRGTGAAMAVMRDAFAAAGYPAYTIDLPGQENVANAQAIAALVQQVKAQTGAAKVHLVAHSMGGLSARYYVARLEGEASVRTYTSMGTSQYGYWPACFLGVNDGGQMCATKPSITFLRDLNAGDDTPGDVAYSSFHSSTEDAQISRLDGGACRLAIPGVEHKDEPSNPQFIQAAIAAVGGTCPGTFVTLPIQ
jgi:triacylglycerol lipase